MDREAPVLSLDDSQNVYSFASTPESLMDFYESIIEDLHTLKVAVKDSYDEVINQKAA